MLIYFPEIFVDGSIVTTHAHVPSLRKFLHLFGQNVNDISLILFWIVISGIHMQKIFFACNQNWYEPI